MRQLIALLFVLILSACGSGGDTTSLTDISQSITSSWNSNGTISSNVSGKVGVPLVATPTIAGIPLSAKGQETFAVNSGTSLPTGLTLNTTTGVITGTPTQAISMAGPSLSGGLVKMQLPGYRPVVVLGIITVLP